MSYFSENLGSCCDLGDGCKFSKVLILCVCVCLKAPILSLTTKLTSCLPSRFYFHSRVFFLRYRSSRGSWLPLPSTKNKMQLFRLHHMDFDDFIPAPALGQFPSLFPHLFYLFVFVCSLKHRTFITLQFWMSEVWNRSHGLRSRYWQGSASLRLLRESVPGLCQLVGAACLSWLMPPDSGRWSLSDMASLWHWTLPLPFPPFKDPGDYMRSLSNLPISSSADVFFFLSFFLQF